MNLRLFKISILLLKYITVIEAIIVSIMLILTINNANGLFFESVCVHSIIGFVLMIIQSYLLKFCNLYRAFLTYNFIVYQCIVYNRYFGFHNYEKPIKIFFILCGIGLFAILFKNVKHFFSCEIENR